MTDEVNPAQPDKVEVSPVVQLAVDPEPEVVQSAGKKKRGRPGADRSAMSSQELKEHKKKIDQKHKQSVKEKAEAASRVRTSTVEIKIKDAREILTEQGIRHPHVMEACIELAQTASRLHRIPFNHYLLAHEAIFSLRPYLFL